MMKRKEEEKEKKENETNDYGRDGRIINSN